MDKVLRTPRRIIHAIAHCEVCDWQAERYTTAAREATGHCRATEHRVAVELGVTYHVMSVNIEQLSK